MKRRLPLFAIPFCVALALPACSPVMRPRVLASCPPIRSDYMDPLDSDRIPRLKPHTGVDIVAPSGHPVLAAAGGVAVLVTVRSDVGLNIILDHGTGEDGRRLYMFYGHLNRIDVKAGQHVKRGHIVGAVGATGSLMPASRTAHLHFEVLSGEGAPMVRTTASGETYLSRIRAENPHEFWVTESGHIASFTESGSYPMAPLRFTYPVLCGSSSRP